MNDNTRNVVTKTVVFAGVTLAAIAIASVVVRPVWLAYVAAALLLVFALLGYFASPAGTGHVADGIVSYFITATLLLCLTASIGHAIVNRGTNSSDEGRANQTAIDLP